MVHDSESCADALWLLFAQRDLHSEERVHARQFMELIFEECMFLEGADLTCLLQAALCSSACLHYQGDAWTSLKW